MENTGMEKHDYPSHRIVVRRHRLVKVEPENKRVSFDVKNEDMNIVFA